MKGLVNNRVACYALMLAFTLSGTVTQSYAAIIGTEQIVAETSTEMQRDEIKLLLEREDVSAQLIEMGVNPDDAEKRVDALTGTEVAKLHQEIETLPAGEGALGTIAIVLVILILLDVAGVTDIFPKI